VGVGLAWDIELTVR